MKISSTRTSALLLTLTLAAASAASSTGCSMEPVGADRSSEHSDEDVAHTSSEVEGENLAGANLAGANLAGTNLAGTNLAGTNLAGTNLAGTNLAGTNLAGTNLAGTNLAGTNLAGADTGHDIYGTGATGLLYSGEDMLQPASARCIVIGTGGTAVARLLSQQSAGARISAALGKLPWGFASTPGGARTSDAWEATLWGDKSHCTFVFSAPPGTAWTGVAGFIKALFRWSAPPAQSIDISGIEASAAVDPTLQTTIVTYTGMMDAASKLAVGVVSESDFLAGELALITATTNNRSVLVDFSSWVRDSSNAGRVLANVESVTPPTYAESAYSSYGLADGTVGVSVSPLVVGTDLLSVWDDLALSYAAYRAGRGPRPSPTRCPAALYMNAKYGEPIPGDQCDAGITWLESPAGYPSGARTWATVPGTTAPMNAHQLLPANLATAPLLRAAGQPLVSEVYTFLWEPNHELPVSAVGGSTGSSRAALGASASSVPGCAGNADESAAFDPTSTGSWCTPGAPQASKPRSLMYAWGASIAITSYRLTSGSSALAADPKTWTFQGCDGSCAVDTDSGWTTLDSRSGQSFAGRLTQNTYAFTNTHAYAQYRLRVTDVSSPGLSTMVVRQLELFDSGGAIAALPAVDRTENGVVTWSGTACSIQEIATRAFDNLATGATATRWCVNAPPNGTRFVAVAYRLAVAGAPVTSYRLTSSADSPKRDPSAWTFEGCPGTCRVGTDDGWVVLDSRTNEKFAQRLQANTYAIASPAAFTQYRLRITANKGDPTALQLGELEMF